MTKVSWRLNAKMCTWFTSRILHETPQDATEKVHTVSYCIESNSKPPHL